MSTRRANDRPTTDDILDHARHDRFDFVVTFGSDALFGVFDDVGDGGGSLRLKGIGNVVIGGGAPVSIHGGNGLTTVVLGNGSDHVELGGAFNTVVLGDGNDVVTAGPGTATVDVRGGQAHVTYAGYLSATLAAPPGFDGIHATPGNRHDIGFLNAGTGNIGAFDGLGNARGSDGNDNIGVFDGNLNGGTGNCNHNIGAFNGNLNGLGNASPSDGNNNGNGNIGVLNGNDNGNLNVGHNAGNGNGNGNVGVDNGNLNGNGVTPVALHGHGEAKAHLVGGFDTIVVGNGTDTITALAGVSTIVAGDGADRISIGGSYDTVVAGNGADHVVGTNVDHAWIALGNGGCTVTLTGAGSDVVKTGSGDDVISLSGTGNWVDAGAAHTFNTIFGGAGDDTFVLHPAGWGGDRIYGFDPRAGDRLDLRHVMVGTGWDGKLGDLGHFLTTETVGGNTLLECTGGSGHAGTVAELMKTNDSLAMLEAHHALIL